jgi:ATP-dependent helicase/DNAse subunit B
MYFNQKKEQIMNLHFPNYPFTKILGWSNSRYDLFCLCKRKYIYSYYSNFFGKQAEKVKELKNLTTIALEIGNLYHDMMEIFLERLQKSDKPIDKERVFAYLDKLCAEKLPRKVFFENYYKTATVDFSEIGGKVKFCVENFLQSPILEWINSIKMEDRKNWLVEAGSKTNGTKYFGETRIDGIKAYCKMDFIFVLGDEIHIVDWKTGKKDGSKHAKQLLAYAVAAKGLNTEMSADKIFPKAVFINGIYEEMSIEITDEKLTDFVEIVKKETAQMQSFCSNIEENIPLPIENFEKRENENICKFCEFRELCIK